MPLDVPALVDRLKKGTYDAAYFAVSTSDTDPSANLDYWLSSGSFHVWHPKQKTPATPWEAEIDRLMHELTAPDRPDASAAPGSRASSKSWSPSCRRSASRRRRW